jgi:hypothetical protein
MDRGGGGSNTSKEVERQKWKGKERADCLHLFLKSTDRATTPLTPPPPSLTNTYNKYAKTTQTTND